MPYISQQFHTLPYYENITDSIQIHETSIKGTDHSDTLNSNKEEYYVVSTCNDQLHRNSLYRSDSGISNSSYDCTTPVPAPRPNSRKCLSVPVYMNLPGKNGSCGQNGHGRSNSGACDVSRLN